MYCGDCVVCNEIYSEIAHIPRVLLCGHTLCTECLTEIMARTNQCPLDKQPINYSHVNDIPKNFALIELAKRIPDLFATIQENTDLIKEKTVREEKLKTSLKRVKQEMNDYMTKSETTIKTLLKSNWKFQKSKIINDNSNIDCFFNYDSRLSQETISLPDDQSLQADDLILKIKDDKYNRLENTMLNKKVKNPINTLNSLMSNVLERDLNSYFASISKRFNAHLVPTKTGYNKHCAQLSRSPEKFEIFIIQELIEAFENNRKIIPIKAPYNSDRVMLVQTAIFAFILKNRCSNRTIYLTNYKRKLNGGFKDCPLCPKDSATLPYNFLENHISLSLFLVDELKFSRAQKNTKNFQILRTKYRITKKIFPTFEFEIFSLWPPTKNHMKPKAHSSTFRATKETAAQNSQNIKNHI